MCFRKWANIYAGVSPLTRGRHVLEAALLPAGCFLAAAPKSGTSSDILLKPNVASWVSGEARYGSEVAIMKQAPPHRQEVETA